MSEAILWSMDGDGTPMAGIGRRGTPGPAAPVKGLAVRYLPGSIVAVSGLVAAGWFLLGDWNRLQHLDFPAYDSAYFQQLVWGLGHGAWFHASFLRGSFLGLHFSPLLLAPGLLELAWPRVELLLVLSGISLGLVAPSAFLALKALLPPGRLAPWLAAGLSASLPFTPILQEAARSGFHTEELGLPSLLLATWAGLRGRPWLACGAALVALAAKEDQFYPVALLGILFLFSGRGSLRRLGTGILMAAGAWALVVLFVVMPWLRAGQPTDTANYYSWLFDHGPAILHRPAEVAGALTSAAGWESLAIAVAALGFLPLLRPRWALAVLPPFAAALLSHHQPEPMLHLQYGLPVVFPLLIAAGMGGRRLLGWLETVPATARMPAAALAIAFIPGLALGFAAGRLPPALLGRPATGRLELAAAREAAGRVPIGADLSVDDGVAAAVAARPALHLLPSLAPDAYVIVDLAGYSPDYADRAGRDRAVAGLASARQLLWSDGRLQLWSSSAGGGSPQAVSQN